MIEKILSKEKVAAIKQSIADKMTAVREQAGADAYMIAVICSDDGAAESYLKAKVKFSESVGVNFKVANLSHLTSPDQLATELEKLNADKDCRGIILELPLKSGFDDTALSNLVAPNKDVDGLGAVSTGLYVQSGLSEGSAHFVPATPQACMELAQSVVGDFSGKNVAVLGRGRTVGKPLANMLIAKGATVTVCHSRTKDIPQITRNADIVFTAMGRPRMLTADYFSDGAVVVDAGIGFVDGSISGDVDLGSIAQMNLSVTPVPGGVGPLTTALLFRNFVDALIKTSSASEAKS